MIQQLEMHSEVMAMILPRKPRHSGRTFYSIAMMTDHLRLLRAVSVSARTMGLEIVTLAPIKGHGFECMHFTYLYLKMLSLGCRLVGDRKWSKTTLAGVVKDQVMPG